MLRGFLVRIEPSIVSLLTDWLSLSILIVCLNIFLAARNCSLVLNVGFCNHLLCFVFSFLCADSTVLGVLPNCGFRFSSRLKLGFDAQAAELRMMLVDCMRMEVQAKELGFCQTFLSSASWAPTML